MKVGHSIQYFKDLNGSVSVCECECVYVYGMGVGVARGWGLLQSRL